MLFKHIFLWVAICFALMLAIPIVSSPQTMWENARTELGLIESAFGTGDTVALARTATETYNAIFIETGLIKKTRAAYVSREEQELGAAVVGGASRAVTGLTNNYLDTFAALTYVMILRVMIFMSWLPFILPFLLAAVGGGRHTAKDQVRNLRAIRRGPVCGGDAHERAHSHPARALSHGAPASDAILHSVLGVDRCDSGCCKHRERLTNPPALVPTA